MKPKSPILMLLVTAVFALLQYFGYSPDLAAADTLSDSVGDAANALTTRNYILLGSVLMTAAIFAFDYWKKLKAGSGGSNVLLIFVFAGSGLSFFAMWGNILHPEIASITNRHYCDAENQTNTKTISWSLPSFYNKSVLFVQRE